MPEYSPTPVSPLGRKRKFSGWMIVLILGVGVLLLMWLTLFPPMSTPETTRVIIPEGASSKQVGSLLQKAGVIRYAEPYVLLTSVLQKYGMVQIGEYKFEKPYNLLSVTVRTLRGEYGGTRVRITFPEGIPVKEMATILSASIEDFKVDEFLALATPLEGKLFPDTYFFFESTPPEQIVSRMQSRYIEKTKVLFEKESVYTENDIMIMASILEREAKNESEAKVISGILWKRLKQGMPLQVDATFLYRLGKGSAQLTLDDLRRDDPYNTYTRKGLPPGPIGNPGIVMIEAALNPVSSPYLYYLHGDDGKIHYAKTYQEHLANKNKYIK